LQYDGLADDRELRLCASRSQRRRRYLEGH
jgi:hypothetical protein